MSLPNLSNFDPKLRMLLSLVVLFTVLLFACEYFFRSDGVLFQSVYSILQMFTTILGLGLRKELGVEDAPPPPGPNSMTSKTTIVSSELKPEPAVTVE